MFKIMDPNPLMAVLEGAPDAVMDELALVMPDIREIVRKNLMWGIFANEAIYSHTDDEVLFFDWSLIAAACRHVAEQYQTLSFDFFDPDVCSKLFNRSVSVKRDAHSYGDLSYNLVLGFGSRAFKLDKFKAPTSVTIGLTLPDSSLVFKRFKPFDSGSEWVLEYLDAYDEWARSFTDKLYRNHYFQIGGHGSWIQGSYEGVYLGQVNADIGDCGSIFFGIDPKTGPFATVDMY